MAAILPPAPSGCPRRGDLGTSREQVRERRTEPQRVVDTALAAQAHALHDEVGAEGPARLLELLDVVDDGRVGQHRVEPQVRRVVAQALEMAGRRPAAGLGGVELEVEDEGPTPRRRDDGLAQPGDEQVRQDRGVPGPGPQDDPVRALDRGEGLRRDLGIGRLDRDGLCLLYTSPSPRD